MFLFVIHCISNLEKSMKFNCNSLMAFISDVRTDDNEITSC